MLNTPSILPAAPLQSRLCPDSNSTSGQTDRQTSRQAHNNHLGPWQGDPTTGVGGREGGPQGCFDSVNSKLSKPGGRPPEKYLAGVITHASTPTPKQETPSVGSPDFGSGGQAGNFKLVLFPLGA